MPIRTTFCRPLRLLTCVYQGFRRKALWEPLFNGLGLVGYPVCLKRMVIRGFPWSGDWQKRPMDWNGIPQFVFLVATGAEGLFELSD
jgi:hypothetical protein